MHRNGPLTQVIKLVANVFDSICHLLLLAFNNGRVGELWGSGHGGRLGIGYECYMNTGRVIATTWKAKCF